MSQQQVPSPVWDGFHWRSADGAWWWDGAIWRPVAPMVSASNAGRNVAIAVVAGCATLVVVWLLLMLILITFGNALGHVFENISTQLGPTPGASY